MSEELQDELETTKETEEPSTQEETTEPEDETEDVTEEQPDDSEDKEDISDELSASDIENMSDEEFEEYLETGKYNKVKPHNSESKVKTHISSQVEKDSSKNEGLTSLNEQKTGNKKVEEATSKVEEKVESQSIDYKAFYDSVMKPFKANGKDIAPRNIDDVISLMQMGANYTKKMQAIAPIRKISESLNKANINEEDLNFLIDIHKGDSEAIKKLLQKHKVDPMELDLESTNYIPSNNLANDSDVQFSEILSDINESLPKIKEIMNNMWDAESKHELLANPRLMQALHEEIQLGRFEIVQKQLENERIFGRYKGVPDIKAYSDLVTQMVEQEKKKQEVANKKKEEAKIEEEKQREEKKKAAPSRNKPSTNKTMSNKDLFELSDEDFAKLDLKV